MAQSENIEVLPYSNLTRSAVPAVKIDRRWQPYIKAGWIILAACVFGIFTLSIPAYLEAFKQGHFLASPVANPSFLVRLLNITGALASFSAALASLILAVMIFASRSDELMAVFVSFYLLLYAVVLPGPLEVLEITRYNNSPYTELFMSFIFTTPTVALFCIFPNGRFVPNWTRWLVMACIPFSPLLLVFLPGSFISQGSPLYWVSSAVWLAVIAASLYAMLYRYRNVSSPGEKDQTKWLVYGLAGWISIVVLLTVPYMWGLGQPAGMEFPLWAHISATIWFLAMLILPAALTISLTRSNIWDINLVVNRTLVYAGLTLVTMLIYIMIVGYIGNLLQAQNRSLIAFLTTGLVAVIFQPLREVLQKTVNRMMYGDRDDPYAVLANLSQRLEAVVSTQKVLPTMVETIAIALRLPYVAVELVEKEHTAIAASYGLPPRNATREALRLPLRYQEEQIGGLILSSRTSDEKFTKSEMQLLEDIARQVGAAAHMVKLAADLQRSRLRLITTREEERRRLRADLHDDLGPQLASMTLKMDAAYNYASNNPQKTRALLEELKSQTRSALEDIRRIAYDLRPPALDELGLEVALREHFAKQNEAQKIKIELETSGDLSNLPAAVEVAVYRIAMEAVSNCIQHSHAGTCTLKLEVGENLQMVIEDDGRGMAADAPHGLGFLTMRERTSELGGAFEVESYQGGGTRILVNLPTDWKS